MLPTDTPYLWSTHFGLREETFRRKAYRRISDMCSDRVYNAGWYLVPTMLPITRLFQDAIADDLWVWELEALEAD